MRPALALLLVALLPAPALAHTFDPRRSAQATVRFEDGAVQVDVLFWLVVPRSTRADRLFARFDLNRDGALDAAEGALLGDELGPEAIGGFVLLAAGQPARPASARAAAKRVGQGVEAAVLVSWRVERGAEVRLGFSEKKAPLPIEVAVLPPLLGEAAQGRLAPGADPLVVVVVPPR